MRFDVHGEHFAIYLLLLAIKSPTGVKMGAKSLQFFFEVQQWMKMRLVGKVEQKTNLHL
jgi:hypothetical protein